MTKEEYIKNNSFVIEYNGSEWSEPKYSCPKCGENMRKNMRKVLASLPPKYEYQCDKCGHVDYLQF